MPNSVFSVVQNTLTTEHSRMWNPTAYSKQHNGNYVQTGGLYINVDLNTNWASYDPLYVLNNPVSENTNYLSHGLLPKNLHDPQTCLLYMQAVAQYYAFFPNDTSFTSTNGSGYLSLSAMIDHLTLPGLTSGDYQPNPGPGPLSNVQSYSLPKGWVYFAWLTIYQALKNCPLLTASQIQNIKNSTLYAPWTYYNTWTKKFTDIHGAAQSIICDTTHNPANYSVGECYLCASALYDASVRFASDIQTGMFFQSVPTTQSPALWQASAQLSATNLLNRGAYNTTYKMFYDSMQLNTAADTDTITSTTCKGTTQAECVEMLVHLYSLTGNLAYQAQAKTALDAYYSGPNAVWDATNGGFNFCFDMGGIGLQNSFKETRSTSELLRTYQLYNMLIAPTYTSALAAMVDVLCNHFYQNSGTTNGFFYRTDPTFGIFVDNYATTYSSTLAVQANPGDSVLSVNDYPGSLTVFPSTNTHSNQSQTITPASMAGITANGQVLHISGGVGTAEDCTVSNLTASDFTLHFANGHSGAWTITGTGVNTTPTTNIGIAGTKTIVLANFNGVTAGLQFYVGGSGSVGTPEFATVTSVQTDNTGKPVSITLTFAQTHSGTWSMTSNPITDTEVLILDGIDDTHGNTGDEEVVVPLSSVNTSGAHITLTIQANSGGTGVVANTHVVGANISSIVPKILETQITSEACGVVCADLLLTFVAAPSVAGTASLSDRAISLATLTDAQHNFASIADVLRYGVTIADVLHNLASISDQAVGVTTLADREV